MTITRYTDEGAGTDTNSDTGKTLVLIHGHPFNRTMWNPQIAYARQVGWRVIAPDLRGYGDSTDTPPPAPGKTRLETFAQDIIGLLDTLGVGRFVLGGLSMGGQIVMECHRQFPDRIRALLLADTFAAADTDEGRALRRTTAERLLREGMAGYAQEVLPKMITPANVHAQPAVARHVLDMMRGTSPEGAAAALRGRAERRDYTGLLRQIEVPTLVVVGEEDAFTPVSDARVIAEHVPGATLKVVAQAGHLPNLERPAEFNAALGEFLGSLPSPAETGS
ncbi:alpha/beta fold hydrolase [Streptomyces natalensis]|uniref:Hydrolase n=1 Tax=Streptomyces natalensis ATCC 27448 TaxID=1240678 RepID=A0A0D7CHE4_9ACTN|nr:alpha/beta fold hydrolase [Streptomyces natalensis]KIZ15471.1 hydrolase [Streptomyces natalensis ATCC 27448]